MVSRIIIVHYYQIGTAATNRIIAYAKSFSELGRDVTLILGCEEALPMPEVKNVNVIGVITKYHFLVVPQMAKVVKKCYTNESSILVYGLPLLCLLLPPNRYNIFIECTEVPLYGKSKGVLVRIIESIKLYLAKKASGMLVISKALKEYFCQRGVRNIAVVNMFVDATRFDINVNEKCKAYIAYCGTVSPFKDGVDCLIKSFAIFHKKRPDYRLKIIGRFENFESEKIVQGLVNSLGLSEVIDFTGMVVSEEMPKMLKGASMLVLARPNNRQAQFGFPTKLGEYLATGNPVVVTNVGEIGAFLHDCENCRLALPSDIEDFADKMLWVVNNPNQARAIGIRGKELTKKEFSAVEQSKKVLDFMDLVI